MSLLARCPLLERVTPQGREAHSREMLSLPSPDLKPCLCFSLTVQSWVPSCLSKLWPLLSSSPLRWRELLSGCKLVAQGPAQRGDGACRCVCGVGLSRLRCVFLGWVCARVTTIHP